MRLDVLPDRGRVLPEAEEVALFRRPLQRNAVRVAEVLELRVGRFHELLRALVVPAVVALEEDVARRRAPLPELAAARLVALGRRPHVVVVRDVEARVERLEAPDAFVHQLLRLLALARGRVGDLLAVLVRAREHERLGAAEPVVPRDDVRHERLVGVAHVRRAVRVVDGRRDVERRGRVRDFIARKVRRAEELGERQGRFHGDGGRFFLLLLAPGLARRGLAGRGALRRGGGRRGAGERQQERRPLVQRQVGRRGGHDIDGLDCRESARASGACAAVLAVRRWSSMLRDARPPCVFTFGPRATTQTPTAA
mmetsp:Transcript_15345/g.47548  ORF Transcript_15345/g.47548 Transcript_15345/m.47548 type:complete len:311 (-) Transcript_15345:51-983(-)